MFFVAYIIPHILPLCQALILGRGGFQNLKWIGFIIEKNVIYAFFWVIKNVIYAFFRVEKGRNAMIAMNISL